MDRTTFWVLVVVTGGLLLLVAYMLGFSSNAEANREDLTGLGVAAAGKVRDGVDAVGRGISAGGEALQRK